MAAAIILAITACSSAFEMLLDSNDVNAKYKGAMEYYSSKKYQKAAQLFESLSVLTSGTARDDTVQYYWGLSNYRYKDFATAETNFANFLQHFPDSPFSADAQFYRLDCLYRGTYNWELDQTPTRTCLAAIDEYLKERPADDSHREACLYMKSQLQERLDRKDFEAGKQYYIMEDYKAARVKLQNVLKANSDNVYREDILYYTAMASYNYARLSVPSKQKERYLNFADDYLNFAGEYPDSKYMQELEPLYKKVQNENN